MNAPGPERGRDVEIDVAPDGEVEDVSQPRVRDEHHGVVVDVPVVLHREPRGLRVRLREHAELVPCVLLQVLYLGGEPGDLTLGEISRDVQDFLRGTGGSIAGLLTPSSLACAGDAMSSSAATRVDAASALHRSPMEKVPTTSSDDDEARHATAWVRARRVRPRATFGAHASAVRGVNVAACMVTTVSGGVIEGGRARGSGSEPLSVSSQQHPFGHGKKLRPNRRLLRLASTRSKDDGTCCFIT